LELALELIGAGLYASKEANAKELTWMGSHTVGFPVPDTLNDLSGG